MDSSREAEAFLSLPTRRGKSEEYARTRPALFGVFCNSRQGYLAYVRLVKADRPPSWSAKSIRQGLYAW